MQSSQNTNKGAGAGAGSNQGHRPINTLAAKSQPNYHRMSAGASPSQASVQGDDSSLFDNTESTVESVDNSAYFGHPSYVPTQKSPKKNHPAAQFNMVKEREPPRPAQVSAASPQKTQQPTQTQSRQVQARDALQPEFGKASPMRNPLKQGYSSVFNTTHGRTEQHRQPPGFRNPVSSSAASSSSSRPAGSNNGAPKFYLPGQGRQASTAHGGTSAHAAGDDGLFAPMEGSPLRQAPAYNPSPIRVPAMLQPKAIKPVPQPIFSAHQQLGARTTFQPFRPPPSKHTIDLTKDANDDDDEAAFDPDAALREDRFGAPDPYAYVDSAQASENIKNLLEGAFEDGDDKIKIKLRKRAKKQKQNEKQEKSNQGKKMSSLEEKLMKLDIDAAPKNESNAEATNSTAAAEEEDDDDEDEEDGTVEGLKIKLLPHQVEGVSWMIDKEIGPRKKNGVLPKGGILADDMGLGKTVQSVTLIMTNPRPALDAKPPSDNPKRKMPTKDVGKGTLVVAPLALIKQWEAEIKDKVEREHALRVLVHHGPSRTKSHAELKKYDVVITTYQILASEHANSSDSPDGPKMGCYGVHWYRVILDEAHSIKNRNAKSTQACYALRSWYRWCLTGTPMQNNLDELQSLICFLQIKPYNHLGTWKDQITTPMKAGRGQIAIKRVQYFLRGFMKRRTKDILKQEGALNFGGAKPKDGEAKKPGMKIVKRDVITESCVFAPEERVFYDQLQDRAQSRLNDMMSGEKTDYIGALVLLLRLRQACNHPQLIQGAMAKDKDALSTGATQSGSSRAPADDDIDALAGALGGLSVETKLCEVCNVKLSDSEASAGTVRCVDCEGIAMSTPKQKRDKHSKHGKHHKKASGQTKPAPRMRNRKVVLDSDDENSEGEGDWLVDDESQQRLPSLGRAGGTDDEDAEGGGETLDSIDSFTSGSASESDDPSSTNTLGGSYTLDNTDLTLSTKIRRLLHILRAETPTHKTIVFSQFTTMLDVIEPFLHSTRIPYVRYDGSMRPDAREASLSSLRSDPRTRVLLCSLKCGSLGLNLTAASRVVLMEPFWNPFVEEQAIDRVHRLNQTVDVKVFRLTVKDTVEERILELQEKKRELAKAAIEGGKAGGKLTMRDIMSLFGRGAEEVVAQDGEQQRDFSMPKLARAAQQGRVAEAGGRNSGSGSGSGSGSQQRLSYDRNDRRGGYEKSVKRITNEDSVYGRR